MKIILLGEPMGLFMANETGALSQARTFTASIAGAEYNVAVGLSRLGHTPAYCTCLGFDPLGERILNGMRENPAVITSLVHNNQFVNEKILKIDKITKKVCSKGNTVEKMLY